MSTMVHIEVDLADKYDWMTEAAIVNMVRRDPSFLFGASVTFDVERDEPQKETP